MAAGIAKGRPNLRTVWRNLTLEGLLEEKVRIGDVFQIGSTVKLQITQPRVPCFKLAYKMGLPEFPKQFLESRRVGFYFRVLEEGEITAGDAIARIEIASESMSVTEIVNLRYFDRDNREENRTSQKTLRPFAELETRFHEDVKVVGTLRCAVTKKMNIFKATTKRETSEAAAQSRK